MTRATRVLIRIFFIFSLAFAATQALAQYGSSLQGVVTDQTGAAVAGAMVTATNNATGVARDTVANGEGFYKISGLLPGTYTVITDATSFKRQLTPDVVVAAEAVHGLNVSLQPGPSQESVTVLSGTEELQTENANVSGTVTAEQVIDLPAFGRDPYQLVRLAPGVFVDGSPGQWKFSGHSPTSRSRRF